MDVQVFPNPEKDATAAKRCAERAKLLWKLLETSEGDTLRDKLGIPKGYEYRIEPIHYNQIGETVRGASSPYDR